MKFTALLSLFVFAGGALSQGYYDVDELSVREMREELVIRALEHVKRQAEDHVDFLTRALADLDNELYIREEWGSGKFKMDLSHYHTAVKPEIIKAFKAHGGGTGDFEYKVSKKTAKRNFSVCGTNPDFHVDKHGDVTPSAVEPSLKAKGLCDGKIFVLDLSALLTQHAGK